MKLTSLLALCLGFFMVIMDVTIVNVALPSIALGLQTSISWLQWIVDGYTLTFACLLLLAGHLGDQLGAKKLFCYAVSAFVITSFLCAIAPSAPLLTLFRLLQGAAAAFIVPTSLALVNLSYHDSRLRSKAIGIWAAMGGIAAASGPIVGAVLTTLWSWRAVFMVNVPFGIVCLYLTAKNVPNVTGTKGIKFDFAGQFFGILAIAALAFALIEVGESGVSAASAIIAFIVFIIALAAFILTEHMSRHPMLPLVFFKSRNFSIAMVVGVLMNLGLYGEFFILPLYFHHIRHYNVLMTGFALFPLMAAVGVSSYYSGKLVSVIGPKIPMILGFIVCALGFILLLIVVIKNITYMGFIVPFLMMGAGIAFAMPAATIAIMRAVADKHAGIASGAFNTSRQIGSLVGVAIFGTIIVAAKNFISGMQLTIIIAAGVFIVSTLLAATLNQATG